ncbi:MAG: hypothetical protein NTW41_05340 [Verrucomicrobia bacterium]|nr:hypothetical protein [Verrucomicrobiota bacterium]
MKNKSGQLDRPTPETDALISKAGFGPTAWEWRQHSRRLERERDDYKWQLHIAKGEISEARQMERAWKLEGAK